MAVLSLTRIFINRMDTGEAVSAQSGVERSRSHGVEGDVRSYAGGRQRAFNAVGERTQFDVTLRLVTQATIDTLRTWVGIPVEIRDHRGQRFVGVYFDVGVAEIRGAAVTEYDAHLTLQTTTYSEGV